MATGRFSRGGSGIGGILQSLRLTLVLSIVVPLMLLSGIAIYVGVTAVERNFDERLREDLELVARAVRGPVSRAVSDRDAIVLDEALQSLFRIGRVYGASVFDADGRQVASLGVADTSVRRSDSAAEAIRSGRPDGTFRRVDGVSVFSQFTPLIAEDGRIQGLLQVTRKRSDFHELVASARIWGTGIWGTLTVIVILVVVLGYYGVVGRHVNRMLAAMSAMAPGNWKMPIAASGPAELRQLHRGLTDLVERMARAEGEIQERMQRERELAEQLRYQEKVAMIGKVAGGVAHELGAPLNVIQGRASILRRSGMPDSGARHVDDIEYQVRRMTRIIEQLLDCFRHVPDARREVDLMAILNETIASLEEDPRVADTMVDYSPSDRSLWLKAEPTRLEMACRNVIFNACQASRSRVRVAILEHDDSVEVRVDDDGPGIDVSLRDDIFEPFYSTRPAGEGTGLGLAVVQSVLKEHQGRVVVTASDLEGCRMSLFWPLETGAER